MELPGFTAIGAMGRYISTPIKHFQPMNCAFGLLDPLPQEGRKRRMPKVQRYESISQRALDWMKGFAQEQTEDNT